MSSIPYSYTNGQKSYLLLLWRYFHLPRGLLATFINILFVGVFNACLQSSLEIICCFDLIFNIALSAGEVLFENIEAVTVVF